MLKETFLDRILSKIDKQNICKLHSDGLTEKEISKELNMNQDFISQVVEEEGQIGISAEELAEEDLNQEVPTDPELEK